MKLDRSGTLPADKAPEAGFTGDVSIRDYFARPAPSRLVGATVRFAPGARTSWKVNPLGQTLLVLSGVGRAQAEGEAVVEIRAGDLVWFAPGQRHWEGAAPDQEMTCLVMQEAQDGRAVEFLERVTDAQYQAGAATHSGSELA